ncbi:hypothetical protein [Novosphingobium capsulatum]|uniref:hypothetical protein n=1 Tax=Novosphingobium capsulatum TaxID=13688 RepID=UPI000A8C6152|nr:hypothetical protein [Novosphingobium capsulatum]WQD92788.1 hypothetical protein U0041_17665 [Novosphingobium capsulatum]
MSTNYSPPGGIYTRIVRKMRRALRNETGAALSYEEVVALLHSDFYPILAEAERKELMALHMERQHPPGQKADL